MIGIGIDGEVQKTWIRLFSMAERLEFQRGQVIFYEGHFPLGLFLLVKGRLTLHSKALGESPRTLEARFSPLIGMDFFMIRLPYPYTAIVDEDARLLFIPRSQILPFSLDPIMRVCPGP